jgi:hypothetical protein
VLKDVCEQPAESAALGGRPSPVQMARKENTQLFQQLGPGDNIVAMAAAYVPQDGFMRRIIILNNNNNNKRDLL